MKIAVIGAGKTGRGFIGRLLQESGQEFLLVDKNQDLIREGLEDGTIRDLYQKQQDIVLDSRQFYRFSIHSHFLAVIIDHQTSRPVNLL